MGVFGYLQVIDIQGAADGADTKQSEAEENKRRLYVRNRADNFCTLVLDGSVEVGLLQAWLGLPPPPMIGVWV